jgi:hypothetical protein
VRTDKTSFRLDKRTKAKTSAFTFDMGRFSEGGTGTSQSGHERNRLFFNDLGGRGSEHFVDVSGISGIDSEADGRSFAMWDFDRDGWLDVALVGANTPLLQVFHNDVATVLENGGVDRHVVALRFVGGNRTSESASEWSSLDGFGVKASFELREMTLSRELRSSEGLAAQNSATMLVGIGAADDVPSIVVRWPSGRSQTISGLPAGTLATVYENPDASPTGAAYVTEPYVLGPPRLDPVVPAEPTKLKLSGVNANAELVMFVTMATTCEACHDELPDLKLLREKLGADLVMYGVPAARYGGPDGTDDTRDVLEAWNEQWEPAYELLSDMSRSDVEAVAAHIDAELGFRGYAATVVTDREGRVLLTRVGSPPVSELRRLLRSQR